MKTSQIDHNCIIPEVKINSFIKYGLLILSALLLAGCNPKNVKNISTTEASAKYGHELGQKLFFAFPGTRENPLRWFDSIPEEKLKKVVGPGYFKLNARPGEIFVFQVGIWALNRDISDLQLEFSDLTGRRGNSVNSSRMTCYNLGGIDFRGNAFKKQINIHEGSVQSLRIGISRCRVVKAGDGPGID